MVLRRRKQAIERVVQDLDAFVKVEEDFVEKSLLGGIVYIATVVMSCALVWSEIIRFLDPPHRFRFVPDSDFGGSIGINVDLTVAMTCDSVGGDILDSTSQNTLTFGRLKHDPAWFEMDEGQRRHFDSMRTFNEYLREEYHSLRDLLWTSGRKSVFGEMPSRRATPGQPPDACRIHGSLSLNKVEGIFHVTVGKSIPLMQGRHAHIAPFMDPHEFNFSHRIDSLSFGQSHSGIIQPLQGDEKIAPHHMMNYQYFVEIVPTEIHTLSGRWPTYQYAVKENSRGLSPESTGNPGIYFKYNVSALKLLVSQDRDSLWQFLMKLCAGVGGLFATSQVVAQLLHNLFSVFPLSTWPK